MPSTRLLKRVSRAAWRATGNHLRARFANSSKDERRPWRQELVLQLMRRDMARSVDRRPADIRRKETPTPLRRSVRRRIRLAERTLANRPCLEITPRGWTPDGASVLYLHGGGYCVCSPQTHRSLGAQIALDSGMRVLLLDYRLAPEFPHPAAIDDADAACDALIEEMDGAHRLFIGGDSAGGGLTLATLVSRRDAGAPLPRGAFLLSPWVDLTLSGESIDAKADSDYLSRAVLSYFARQYLGTAEPTHPLVSPLRADLRGLPPTLLQVGGAETLLTEGEQLAQRLEASDVATELQVFPDACHVFQVFAPLHPDAGRAVRGIGDFLRRLSVDAPT